MTEEDTITEYAITEYAEADHTCPEYAEADDEPMRRTGKSV